ncbi:MAG: hypothetical protein IJR82_01935 [Bacilli bacterium]|nr:hypothetical protein [Bacilli bacterium]
MNRKWLLGIILILTIASIVFILVLTHKTKYNKLIVSNDKWNDIINSRNISTDINLESIEFNDYNLLIDNENSIIYYSVVDVKSKYNPSVKYTLNGKKIKIAFNKEISDEVLENTDALKVIIYDDSSYKIYTLVATKYPILNVNYKGEYNNRKKMNIKLEIFDNYVNSPNRILKSDGELRVIEEDKEYAFSLKKESMGHNERENYISIFGVEKQNEYLIKATDTTNKEAKYVQFFINNEYKGLYTFGHNEGRRIDNFERNRENNK